jgi:hypothetical protein
VLYGNNGRSFKIRQVDTFVSQVSTRLKQIRPQLKMSAAAFPLRTKRTVISYSTKLGGVGTKSMDRPDLFNDLCSHTGTLEDKTKSLFDWQIAGNALIIPGIRLLKVPDQSHDRSTTIDSHSSHFGIRSFATENLNPNLQTILNRIQGLIITKKAEPLPHRQPFKTAQDAV